MAKDKYPAYSQIERNIADSSSCLPNHDRLKLTQRNMVIIPHQISSLLEAARTLRWRAAEHTKDRFRLDNDS